jgi:1,4-dihydroxy-2-naphthoyl-CoA hydrolase
MECQPWLRLERTVRFGDTDAAGVIQFHQLLRWCHEAYEESLERFGIGAAEIFPRPEWAMAHPPGQQGANDSIGLALRIALPIVHCSADYRRPLVCGDRLEIGLQPRQLDQGSFEVAYSFSCRGQTAARGLTRHRAITIDDRQGCALPAVISAWLEACQPSTEAPDARSETDKPGLP